MICGNVLFQYPHLSVSVTTNLNPDPFSTLNVLDAHQSFSLHSSHLFSSLASIANDLADTCTTFLKNHS